MNNVEASNVITELANNFAKEKEATILAQLNEFISRGLLVVEQGPMVMVHERSFTSGNGVKIEQAVNLKLKDQEYVEKLEWEVRILEEKIKKHENIISTMTSKLANSSLDKVAKEACLQLLQDSL
jgi:ribosome-interacting GTPase 1